MKTDGVSACVFWICVVVTGCVHTDGPYNQCARVKLRLDSASPQAYSVHVESKGDCIIDANGCAVVDVPRVRRGRATYLLGVVKVGDLSPDDIPVVDLKKGDRTVRKLSLNDLKRLAIDSDGYSLLRTE